jgi:N-acetyl sugar amidotransferase
MIKYCKQCLNQEPSVYSSKKKTEKVRTKASGLNYKGICRVCIYENSKKKNIIDFNARIKELKKIIKSSKKNNNTDYDCIVTVSGGKDSMRQAFYARDVLKLNCLLVSSVYPPEQQTKRGSNNLANLINHGFDCISMTLDPIKWKQFMKHSFFEFGNFFRPTEMALFAIPVHVAISYQIPLLFYGENGLYTTTFGTTKEGKDGNAQTLKEGNTVKGGPKSLKIKNVKKSDYHFYEYPSYAKMNKANLKLVYLGYYMKDWYAYKNAKIAIENGLEIRKDHPGEMGDLWGYAALDEDFRIVNQYLRYLKLGNGQITDQVCEAIHQNIMTREEGIEKVKMYDGACDEKYIIKLCEFFGISKKEFNEVVDNFVNRNLFEYLNGKWLPKFKPE